MDENQTNEVIDTATEALVDALVETLVTAETQSPTQEPTNQPEETKTTNPILYSTDTGKNILSQKVIDFLNTCRDNGDHVTPHAFARLEEYILKMTDSPDNEIVSDRAGILQQKELLRSLTQIFTQTPTNVFRRAYGHYLDVVRDHLDGAFHTTMVARFLDHDLMDADAKQTFVKLVNLLIKTCRSDRASVAKQVDISRSLQALGEEAVNRAANFYRK